MNEEPYKICLRLNTDEAQKLITNAKALSLIHISEPTRQAEISYAVFCLKKKKKEREKSNMSSRI